MILLAAVLFLPIVMSAAWAWQRRLRNAGWVDAFWTFGLGLAGAATAVSAGPHGLLVTAFVALWSVRLGMHILGRTRNAPEDSRYARFREEWGADFQRRMFIFLQIQAAAAIVLLIPLYSAAAAPTEIGWRDWLALAVIVAAIGGEGIADAQLQRFRAKAANRGLICETGLWRWSRHPNYFFEWLHWLAYPLLALGSAWFWPALIGPALMYWLLVHVSGIPPLEAQMLRSRGDAYRDYQRRVRAFFPVPRA